MKFPFQLESKREFDVIGFGTNSVDHLIVVPKYPEFDSKIELSDSIQAPGGEIATTLVGLQRLGCNTAYIGSIGMDKEGDFLLAALKNEGVNIDLVKKIKGASTQIAFIIIDQESGERTVIWKRDKKLSISPEKISIEIPKRGSVLHFTPHDTEACIRLAKEAHKAATITSIDIDNVFIGIEKLLPHVDILFISEGFARLFYGEIQIRDSLIKLHEDFGCPLVGVTLGSQGSLIYSQGKFIETNGFTVPGGCIDTTGAGDAFRMGFLYGLINGADLIDSAKIANAVAALNCRGFGAQTALPTKDELDILIR